MATNWEGLPEGLQGSLGKNFGAFASRSVKRRLKAANRLVGSDRGETEINQSRKL